MLLCLTLLVGGFITTHIIKHYRNTFFELAQNSVSLLNELLSKEEDEKKIEDVQKGTNSLLLSLLKTIFLFIGALLVGSISVLMYSFLTGVPVNYLDFTSFFPIIFLSFGASLPFLIPKKSGNNFGYSELSRLLHRMVLDNYNIGNKLFQWEKMSIKKQKLSTREDFVIVSGLARAGTTSLMNSLAGNTEFKSLTYANMPFLMSPNLWAKIYKPKMKELKERSHKDGVMIGLNSNEALEEYFFKLKTEDKYIQKEKLTVHSISKETYQNYLDYQSLIKGNNQHIYLAKNNNFILRYDSMREWNNEFLMVILFRDPLSHASSLFAKHQEYSKLQEEVPFILEYMNWLGHHEFGKGQKPFSFEDSELDLPEDRSSLDYWISHWIKYYEFALKIDHSNTLFINYDDFCNHPNETIDRILKKTKATTFEVNLKPFKNKRKIQSEYSTELFAKATGIYDQLLLKE